MTSSSDHVVNNNNNNGVHSSSSSSTVNTTTNSKKKKQNKSPPNNNNNNNSYLNGGGGGRVSMKTLTKWDVRETVQWLRRAGFGDCERYFVEHKINGRALLMLDEDDLKEVVRDNVGQRKNLYHLIKTMQVKYRNYVHSSSFEDEHVDEIPSSSGRSSSSSSSGSSNSSADDEDESQKLSDKSMSMMKKKKKRKDGGSDEDDDDDVAKTSEDEEGNGERMLKNSSFIRQKVKLGVGLGLRNRSKLVGSSKICISNSFN